MNPLYRLEKTPEFPVPFSYLAYFNEKYQGSRLIFVKSRGEGLEILRGWNQNGWRYEEGSALPYSERKSREFPVEFIYRAYHRRNFIGAQVIYVRSREEGLALFDRWREADRNWTYEEVEVVK